MWVFCTSVLLPLAVSCAAVKTKRQTPYELLQGLLSPDGLMPLMPPLFGIEEPVPVKSDKSWTLQPQIRKDATRKLIRWGPFEVPGMPKPDEVREFTPISVLSMDPMGTVMTATLVDGFCRDCTVLAGKTDIAFANGTRADISSGVYLHHVLTVDRSKPAPTWVNFCPALDGDGSVPSPFAGLNPFGMLFLGGGNDGSNVRYSPTDSKFQSGYYIEDNVFAMTADVVNYNDDKKEIYVTYDVEYLPGRVGTDASSTMISVTGCDFRGYMDTAPVSHLSSENFTLQEDGWIVSARGHLHDGGEAMQLFLNEKLVCNSTATYGGKGGTVKVNGTDWKTISSMTECHESLKVKKGDHLRMASLYNTTKHPLRESDGMQMEEMGMFTLAFAPAK